MKLSELSAIIIELNGAGALDVVPTGSHFTCDPPVETTDKDFAVLVESTSDLDGFLALGYVDCTLDPDSPQYQEETLSEFRTLRRDKINLIVMTKNRYTLFKACTDISTRLNLLDKEDRVYLFVQMREHLLPLLK